MKQTSDFSGRHGRCAAWEGQGENYAIFFNGVSSIKTTQAVYGQQNWCSDIPLPKPARIRN